MITREQSDKVIELIRSRVDAAVLELSVFDGSPAALGQLLGTLTGCVEALARLVGSIDERIDDAIHEHAEDAPHLYPDGSS